MADHAPPRQGAGRRPGSERGQAEGRAQGQGEGRQSREGREGLTEPLEYGRWLFAQECRFVAGATTIAVVPEATLPEIAFAGRSNVGKSSLVNALTGRRTLARTSNTPGRTRQLNFFELGGRLMLCDLPGYGYAQASKTEVAGWTKLTMAYLRGRPTLRRICLLIDSRHGIKPSDEEVMTILDRSAVSWQAVLTKVDKVRPDELEDMLADLAPRLAKHPACHPEIAATSAETGQGVPELRASLAALAAPDQIG